MYHSLGFRPKLITTVRLPGGFGFYYLMVMLASLCGLYFCFLVATSVCQPPS
jgi:hypothetical protein